MHTEIRLLLYAYIFEQFYDINGYTYLLGLNYFYQKNSLNDPNKGT